MRIAKKPKIIFFDWDGTIVNTMDFTNECFNSLIKAFPFNKNDVDPARNRFIRLCKSGATMPIVISEIYKGSGYDINEINRYQSDHYSSEFDGEVISLRDGMLDLMNYLFQRQDIKIAIVSNKETNLLIKDIDFLGMSDKFEVVVGYDQIGIPKPDPRLVYHAANLLKKNEEDIPGSWFVGDTVTDMQCAINAGLIPFFVGHDSDLPAEFRSMLSEGEIKKYPPVKMVDLLQKLN